MNQRRAGVSNETLARLHRTMLRIRLCEESLVGPILSGEIKTPCHLYTGQEAIAAGVCEHLEPTDTIFGHHRSHGHFLAKGGSMDEMVAEIYCRDSGCSRGLGGSMHITDPAVGMLGSAPIVAGTISLALGAALASHVRGDDRVTVSFFGDGAAGEGALYESLNFAALRKLPIIFACENNLYSTHLPLRECHPEDRPLHLVGEPFGVYSSRIDGNDVLATFEAARDAVARCRGGEGPVFLEFMTYRMRGHVGPDDNIQGTHTDIRPDSEVAEWQARDPIDQLERRLIEDGVMSRSELDRVREKLETEVEAAHEFARNSATPTTEEAAHYVFPA